MQLCIYHAGCTDGVAAAYILHKHGPGSWEFYPGAYQTDPPWELIDRCTALFILDFSYPADVMKKIAKRCLPRCQPVVLDHHDTAREALEPLLEKGVIGGEFNLDKCGARITWDWVCPWKQPPRLLEYIDARDRWVRPAPDGLNYVTRYIQTMPHEHPIDFAEWDRLFQTTTPTLLEAGEHLERYARRHIDSLIEKAKRVRIGKHSNVPCVNAPWFYASELGNELASAARHCQFAIVWWTNSDGSITASLRSVGDGPHVGKLAQNYGGGGHPRAAGFRSPVTPWTLMEDLT